MSRIYDNWERLVEATLDREKLRQIALADSRESSFSSIQSDFTSDSPLYYHSGNVIDNLLEANGFPSGSNEINMDRLSYQLIMQERVDSCASRERPAVKDFQIIGGAKPGFKLTGCGYAVHGTSLCTFQWVRYYPDGSMQFIEGATDPEYLLTVADVDNLIALECLPMDEEGREGDLVRAFANNHKKIHEEGEEVPGIEEFQVIGAAKPGLKLKGCGFPVHGTSLCMFQWVRHYPDGSKRYIEGATNPDYVVTVDDIDNFIAVECIPMDEHGRQGDLLRVFANNHQRIIHVQGCFGVLGSKPNTLFRLFRRIKLKTEVASEGESSRCLEKNESK